MKKVLNVGGNDKKIPIPVHYSGYEHVMLDIDPASNADIICDARLMNETLDGGTFDAIYCSHNLEHYYRHDLEKVLSGFKHVLKEDGFVEIHVPNMQKLFDCLANGKQDIEDVIYNSPAGPIRAVDIIYGHAGMIERSGNDFMCHKNGFTPKSLANCLYGTGFDTVFIGIGGFGHDLVGWAFNNAPSQELMDKLNLKNQGA